jgi:hypothetical protein
LYAQKTDAIKAAIGETQRIFKTYFFPEMKTNWATHPNNIGHLYSSGCFRCHDGEHVTNTGKVIRNDATSFKHPINLGDIRCFNASSVIRSERHRVGFVKVREQ